MADKRFTSPDSDVRVIGQRDQFAVFYLLQLIRWVNAHGLLEDSDPVTARMNLFRFTIHGDANQVLMVVTAMATMALDLDQHQFDAIWSDLLDEFDDLF
jgi:hypothetical protein